MKEKMYRVYVYMKAKDEAEAIADAIDYIENGGNMKAEQI